MSGHGGVSSGTASAAGGAAAASSGEKTSSGVQRLLDTEKEANRLVLEARQCRKLIGGRSLLKVNR